MARLVAVLNVPIGGNLANATQAISAPTQSPVQNVQGLKTISIQVLVSAASTPGTASASIQVSNDNVTWYTLSSPASQNITANGGLIFRGIVDPDYQFIRVNFAIASGSFTAVTTIFGQAIRD